jgi:hypothetical protein
MRWTYSTNKHGWLAWWSAPGFRIEKHIGPDARYDLGYLTGQRYQVIRAEKADGSLALTDDEIEVYRYGARYHLLAQAKAAAELQRRYNT